MDAGPISKPRRKYGWRPEGCDRVALVLQGGGALGAYQAGVYEALHEAGIRPDWINGVSIGAINAAIIAGNRSEERVEKLRTFWDRVTERRIWPYTPDGDVFRRMRNVWSQMTTVMFGQPGFFLPQPLYPWWSPRGARTATSYYDTAPLRDTLNAVVDWDLLREQEVRLAVGAANVLTGNKTYFDNFVHELSAEHVMASAALPPSLPAIQIGSDWFWDGGIVSNTPLQYLLEQEQHENTLVFQVDLFSARGPLPREMDDVLSRFKDIRYSSRTRYVTKMFQNRHAWKLKVKQLLDKMPEDLLSDEERQWKRELATLPEISILHLIYQQKTYESHGKDYDFSGTSMREHWRAGYEDTSRTLRRRDWLSMPRRESGLVTHDVHRAEEWASQER